MNSKPKNFSEALHQMDELSDSAAQSLKSRLEAELHGLEQKFAELKPQLDEIKTRVRDEAKKAKGQVETQVRANPWTTIGVVGLIFFVLGFLLAGRHPRNRD